MTTITHAAAVLAGHQHIANVCGLRAHRERLASTDRFNRPIPARVEAAQAWGEAHREASDQLNRARGFFAEVATSTPAANEAAFFCPER